MEDRHIVIDDFNSVFGIKVNLVQLQICIKNSTESEVK